MPEFSDIRSILQRPASQATWEALTQTLADIHDKKHLESVLLPYAQAILARWPMHVRRRAPRTWFLRKNSLTPREQPHVLWPLVDTFYLEGARPQSSTFANILRHTQWERITGIEIARCYMDTKGAQQLAALPLEGLDVLRMMGNHTWTKTMLRGPGAQVLIRSGLLDRLTHLEISNHNIGNRAARDLFQRDLGANLRTLNLKGNRIGGKLGVQAMLTSPWLSQVTHLDLSFNNFIPETADLLSHAENLSQVTWLSLWGNRSIQLHHIERLIPKLPSLTHLDLTDTGLIQAQIRDLNLPFITHTSSPTQTAHDLPLYHMRTQSDGDSS